MEASKVINLTELEVAVEETWGNNKVPFFFDCNGNAEVFFKYKAHLCEIHKIQIGVAMGTKTLDEAKEEIRSHLHYSMKAGDTLVFFIDKIMGKFNDYYDEAFLPKEIFDPIEIVKEEIYKKIIKEDEDVDSFGNKGGFVMRDTFRVVVLSTREPDSEDNSDIAENLDPEKFDFIKIE
mmetsp:Transcript_10556/g.12021  ORF Transcript_10556/g.12021 Transcript_10556/m.12021 type:complete len:178 (+) Transcript_10556:30-563(+)